MLRVLLGIWTESKGIAFCPIQVEMRLDGLADKVYWITLPAHDVRYFVPVKRLVVIEVSRGHLRLCIGTRPHWIR